MARRVSMALALLSLAVYIIAARSAQRRDLRETGAVAFAPERYCLAAAVTHTVYGAPLGAVSTEVLNAFMTFVTPIDALVEQQVHAIRSGAKPPGHITPTNPDGNGLGYVVFATIAMRAFGPHLSSITHLLFLVLTLSAVAFAWRFRDERLIAVPLFFSALTLMLFGPLSSADLRGQIEVGGIRYFAAVAVLPALHLFLEMADSSPRRRPGRWTAWLALGIQVAILILAVLARSSGLIVLPVLALTCAAFAWRRRGDVAAFRSTVVKGAAMALVAAAVAGGMVGSVPGYAAQGRVVSVVWHRVFISLGMNPAWPFGNLKERYDCTKYIPEGFEKGGSDRTGHCVWVVYALQHHLPLDQVLDGVNSGTYDRALRDAFLDVARTYPAEVLKTFFWYKPLAFKTAIVASMQFAWPRSSSLDALLLVIAIGLPLACGPVCSALPTSSGVRTLAAGILLLGATFTIPSLIAWANTATIPDLVVLCLAGAGLLVATLAASARQRLSRVRRGL